MAIVKKRIPGFQDGGNAVEPTTGNDVPVGALPNEVADDIPARLSEGEFIFSADVVRFIGLERLMKLRDEAKEGLRRMAEVGQMGNAEDVGEKADESFEEEEDTSKFESDIDEILSEVESPEGQTEQAFAEGGVVGQPWIAGTDLKKAPKNPVFDVRYYRHSDGRLMYITFFNGKPMMPIPEGFTPTDKPVEQQIGKEVETKRPEGPSETGTGYGDAGTEAPVTTGGPDIAAIKSGDFSSLPQTSPTVSPGAVKSAATAIGLITGLPIGLPFMNDKVAQKAADALTMAAGKAEGNKAIEAVGKAFGLDTSTQAGRAAASSFIDSEGSFMGGKTATTGAEGTGGAASRAGAEAAAQVGQLGLSPSAQGQASQQAANAVIAGADPSTAVSNAVDAAVNAAQGGSTVGVDALGPGGTSGAPDAGTGGEAGFGVGVPFKKGGLVSKPVKASKKYKGKGLAAR